MERGGVLFLARKKFMKNRNKKLREVKMHINFTDDFALWKYYVDPKQVVLISPFGKRIEVPLEDIFKHAYTHSHRHDWNGEGKVTVSPQDVKNYICSIQEDERYIGNYLTWMDN